MNGLALVLALAVAQAAQTPAAAERPVAEPAAAAPDGTAPKQAPSAVPAVAERRGPASADPTASPLVRPDGATEAKAAPRTRRAPIPSPEAISTTAARPPPGGDLQAAPRPRSIPAPAPPSPPTTTVRPATLEPRPPAPIPQASPLPERDAAERVARAFLDALAGADADALAQASSERFSFDGEPKAGRDAIRRTWRDLLAGRAPAASRPAIGRVEVLSAADATARFGKPPARIAPLARVGVLVVVGEVGGRTVVLFLGREAGRMAVLGMHD